MSMLMALDAGDSEADDGAFERVAWLAGYLPASQSCLLACLLSIRTPSGQPERGDVRSRAASARVVAGRFPS